MNINAKVQETFSCRCAEKCYSNLSEENKTEMWDYFYSLDTKNTQDAFLQSLIEKREPIRHRKPNDRSMDRHVGEDMSSMDDDNSAEVDSGAVSRKKENVFLITLRLMEESKRCIKILS